MPPASTAKTEAPARQSEDENVDAMFETDDQTLEELLADVTPDENQARPEEPSDEQVKALLEQLSKDIPKEGGDSKKAKDGDGDKESDSDNSDGEEMNRKADEVMERFRDEAEVDASRPSDAHQNSDKQSINEDNDDNDDGDNDDDDDEGDPGSKTSEDIDMPSVPSNLEDLPAPSSRAPKPKTVDDIAARMAALRAPSHDEDEGEGSLDLPSVPTSRPAGKPVKRLTSRTNYTDDDVDSWCTVCLEDATLRCLGCDNDVYCRRCWGEMHVGPAAAFDDRAHRAVQFSRSKKKEKPNKVALGA